MFQIQGAIIGALFGIGMSGLFWYAIIKKQLRQVMSTNPINIKYQKTVEFVKTINIAEKALVMLKDGIINDYRASLDECQPPKAQAPKAPIVTKDISSKKTSEVNAIKACLTSSCDYNKNKECTFPGGLEICEELKI